MQAENQIFTKIRNADVDPVTISPNLLTEIKRPSYYYRYLLYQNPHAIWDDFF